MGLPPDIQKEISSQRGVATRGGIGSRAPQNAASAAARAAAMGTPPPETESVEASTPGEPVDEDKAEACSACGHEERNPQARFCSNCGESLLALTDPIKLIGIDPFTEDDIEEYLFKGYVTRTMKLVGKHVITLRSSLAKDMRTIDHLFLNTDFVVKRAKDRGVGGDDGRASENFIQQMKQLAFAVSSLVELDNKKIVTTMYKEPHEELEAKLHYVEERGSALADIIVVKATLFNRAITKYLREEATVLGS